MLTRSDIRIAAALVLSVFFHGLIMMQDFGFQRDPLVHSFRKQVSFQLTRRVKPAAKPVVKKETPPQTPEKKKTVQPVKAIQNIPQKPAPVPVKPETKIVPEVVKKIPSPVQKQALKEPTPVIQKEQPQSKEQEEVISTLKNSKPESGKVVMARPLYRQNPPPRYPAKARRKYLEGIVVIEVFVNPAGRVDSLQVKESSGHRILDKAALSSVRNWVFEPGSRNGVRIGMKVLVPVRFKLEQ